MRPLPTGTVTFLFTDVEGSTQLVHRLGERYPAVLARHHALIREAIAAEEGIEVSTEGDAFFIVFAQAAPAVRAVTRAQRALASEPWPDEGRVTVRMGMHSGIGELLDDTYVGIDVHRAARVAAAGHGGQVLLTESTRALAGIDLPDQVSVRDLGRHRLKDLPVPEQIFQLVIPRLPTEFPPLRSMDARLGNLPDPASTFIGREPEIEQVDELLSAARLVTLTGPGGTGKTRLSIEVARHATGRFPDGTWFVPLETIRDPDLVVPQIAGTLGVREQAGQSRDAALDAHLSAKQTLLVLDNLEQVVAAGPQIGRLVSASPRVRVLASSREALRVSGEREFPVPPMSRHPAVDLFVARARQIRPDFMPDAAELDAIAEICRRVDGLPLAIELAAARIRVLSSAQILERLGDRLKLLSGGGRDLGDRQRTLRGAIEWSYDLLSKPERQYLARLGAFHGAPDLSAIEAVIDPDGELGLDALDAVASLSEKSLLRQHELGGQPLFGMLETIREFARERLNEEPDVEVAVRERHARHYVDLAERLEPEFLGPNPSRALDLIDANQEDLRGLIRWSIDAGRPDLGLRAAAATWRFSQQRGHLAEGRATLTELLATPGAERDTVERARALSALGGIVYWQGDMAAAGAGYEEALALARRLGDSATIANALYDAGFTAALSGDVDRARALQQESFERYNELGDLRRSTMAREALVVVETKAGNLAEAGAIEEEVLSAHRALGTLYKLGDGMTILSLICLLQGNLPAARRYLAGSMSIARRIGDRSAWATDLQMAAALALREGREDDALTLCGALLQLQEMVGPSLLPASTLGLPDPNESLRARLSSERYAAGIERGRRSDIEPLLREIEALAPTSD